MAKQYQYSKEEYKEMKEKEYSDLIEKLDTGIKGALDSDKYKEFLKTMSKFYKYSANNSILIGLQKENATLVASAKNWAKQNVRIDKEEWNNSIKIICGFDKKYNIYEKDENGNNILDENNNPKIKETKTYTNYNVGYVYDISQTSAKNDEKYKLKTAGKDPIAEKDKILKGLEKVTKIKIDFQKNLGGASGVYNVKDNTIKVKQGMSDMETISTAVHESAHSMLHNLVKDKTKSREQQEFEAESVAFVVCERLGIDSKNNNFLYLANWVGDKDLQGFKDSIKRIQNTSRIILQELAPEEFNMDQDKNKSEDLEL